MASKLEQLLKHIESLLPGERVSVRNLAKTMSVSEGTAYKAIKCAENTGLVVTKPNGTVRISAQSPGMDGKVTIAAAVVQLGLTVLAGERYTDTKINSVVLADCSLEQFKADIENSDGKPLCIVGDRPDIMQEAIAFGANIIVTNGATLNHGLLAAAVENHSCVLSSAQKSYTLMSHLQSIKSACEHEGTRDIAGDWMRIPLYLYYNDIAADLQRVYRPILSMFSKCAVVNDDLNICGTVDAVRALSASPSLKLANLYQNDENCFVVDEHISIEALADHMISEGTSTAFITRNEKLSGIITSNDILRYFRFKGYCTQGAIRYSNAIETVERNKQSGINIYMIKIPERALESMDSFPGYLFSVLFSAARRQCCELFGSKCDFESGTFYSVERNSVPGELTISSEIINKSPFGCTIEAEIYDEYSSYARCIFVASVSKTDGQQIEGE